MDLRKGWEALKVRLQGWLSEVFGSGTSETSLSEASLQETPSEITSDASDELVSAVREMLEHLRHNRRIVVRKKNNRMERQVVGADFTDAYLFLLSIPGADISLLRHRTAADDITYTMELPDGTVAELTDKTLREDIAAVLRLINNGQCVLKINFINDIQKIKRRNDNEQPYFNNDRKIYGRTDGTNDSLRRHAGNLRGEVPRHERQCKT